MPASKTPGVCPTGRIPMVMVAVTELLAVSITSTEASCAGLPGAEHNSRPQVIEVTYALLPSGVPSTRCSAYDAGLPRS